MPFGCRISHEKGEVIIYIWSDDGGCGETASSWR